MIAIVIIARSLHEFAARDEVRIDEPSWLGIELSRKGRC
jgi:hypothetical protein